jgi:protocatechuate 3,4-dioxygenase beta subunit
MSEHPTRIRLTRRETLTAGAAASAAFLIPSIVSLAGNDIPPALAAAITLTPEQEEGPFYVDLERVRSAIALGQAGVPLDLTITVLNSKTGAAIAGAAVDVWQCNAGGVYSDESSEKTLGKTYLRGIQLTDSGGRTRFKTIYPGHYAGRATHIHAKVHIAGGVSGGTYSGGHVSHTGQLFFDDTISTKVYRLPAYRLDKATRVLDTADRVYTQQGGSKSVVKLRRAAGALASHGFLGSVTLAVDPESTPAATGTGAGQGSGEAGPGGR